MPRIVEVLLVNMVGASSDRPRTRELRAAVAELTPDVVIAVECNDVRLSRVLGPGWIVHQGWVRGRQNSAVAVRVRPGWREYRRKFLLGSSAMSDPAIGARWIARLATFHGLTEAVCWQAAHVPPWRNKDLYPQFRRNLAGSWSPRFVVTGLDQNRLDVAGMARYHKMHYYKTPGDVMSIVSSLPFKAASFKRYGFDHSLILARVDLTKAEKR